MKNYCENCEKEKAGRVIKGIAEQMMEERMAKERFT
jgi:hypothetical protein